MVMASGQDINIDAFEEYGVQTAKLFVSLYPWFYMPSSVHKILIHGADVIRFAILPIGKHFVIQLFFCLFMIIVKIR